MLETFIINGERIEINIYIKVFNAERLEVTTFTDGWENYISNGYRFLYIHGEQINQVIDETFQIVGEKAGILILKSLPKN